MHKPLLMITGLLCLAACQSDAQQKATKQMTIEKEKATHVIDGQIESIRLQNINKRQGYYTYNVSLVVAPTSVTPALDKAVKQIKIRVDKVYWSKLDDAQQKALAPDGPKSLLTPKTYKDFAVGQKKQLSVTISSMGDPMPLGHLVQ